MTKREAIVLSAFTGTLLCDLDDYLKYVSKMFGCTISKQELPMLKEDIQERVTEETMQIINNLSDGMQGETQEELQGEVQIMMEQAENEEQSIVEMVMN